MAQSRTRGRAGTNDAGTAVATYNYLIQTRTLSFDRRDFIKTTGIALGSAALLAGSASAESTYNYELVGEALDAKVEEVVVQGDWAYMATIDSITTVDLSDPALPIVGGTALANGTDNNDAKVDGDVAGLANDGDPPGVTFFDVSDPATPIETSFYEAASGIHNHFIEGDYAYLCVNDSFEYARMVIVDISDPANPVSLEGEERGSGGAWMLRNHHGDMAEAGINPIHDIFVQDGLAYLSYWDAGVVVVDVTDPTDPTAVAHFGATDQADEKPSDTVELYKRYLSQPGNAHYTRPLPDGDLTFVGAETFLGPFEDVVIQGDHGGIRVFDTSDVSTDRRRRTPTKTISASSLPPNNPTTPY